MTPWRVVEITCCWLTSTRLGISQIAAGRYESSLDNVLPEQFGPERLRIFSITVTLKENVEHEAVFIRSQEQTP